MTRDEFKVPDEIASFTEEKRKEVARSLIRTTHLANARIADVCHLKVKQVASMRLRMSDKIPSIGENLAAPPPEPAPVQVPEQQVDLHDIDAPAPEVKPAPVEKNLAHVESEVRDIRSRIDGFDAKLSMVLAAVKNGGAGRAPGQQQETRVEESVANATFDIIPVKVGVDSYRLALFSAWKGMHNAEAAASGGQSYSKDFDGFLLDAFDEFMEKRGIDFTYTQTTTLRPQMIQPRGVR